MAAKLKEYLAGDGSLSDVKKMLGDKGLKPIGACYQAGLMFPSGKTRDEIMKEFSENLEICRYLEIPVLIVLRTMFLLLKRDTIMNLS